ncbi:MAG: sigma-54 dependent transcriptional regulator [Thermodesulfovibrionales bacterium]|nr:sigma-54 dependent transcriptional regulator [Thermodesulfovibrionales bacterium]
MKNSPVRILIADDEKNFREVLMTTLSDEGFDVTGADSSLKAKDLLEKEEYDVLLLDLNMPEVGGMEVLKKIKTFEIPTEVVILTGVGIVSTAVEAMKLGAYDYLTKPFKIEELKAVIEKAYEKKKLRSENLLLKTQIKRQFRQKNIITKNTLMLDILETVKKVASPDSPVLIYGESGVGKELIARAIHDASERAEKPYIPINCGAIPENIIESELFGHEKGSFTGAYEKKLGLLEIADGGTLFLDEIGDLQLQLQIKLLRVIETKSFFRVGGIREMKVDVKFVFATNKDIKTETEKGRFRHDLYYRISALTIHIPPLRERNEDIPLLIAHFRENNPAFKHKKFSKDALDAISEYSWPGNVRELQNVLHRTLLLSKADTITREDLPADLITGNKVSGSRLEDIEKNHILKILREAGGQRGRAAEILGIDPKTLYRKLMSYGIKE